MSERLSPESERLVSAGRAGLAPSAADIERVRGRILAGVAAGVAVTAGSASAAAAASTGGAAAATGSTVTAGGLGVLKVVVVAAALTGATVTGGVMIAKRSSPAVSDGVRPPAPAPRHPARRPQREAHQPVVAPLPEAPDAGAVVVLPAPPGVPPPREKVDVPSLASEMDLLRRARTALRAGEPRTALEHLDRHDDRYPDSSLAPEATAIRIEATCAVGDRETARALAARFVRRWPASRLARRVPHLCGDEP